MTDTTDPDPRQVRNEFLNAENQALVDQLARRGVQVSPQTFTDGKVIALVQILTERGDSDLMIDVMVRYGELLQATLQGALSQTTSILLPNQMPPSNGSPL